MAVTVDRQKAPMNGPGVARPPSQHAAVAIPTRQLAIIAAHQRNANCQPLR